MAVSHPADPPTPIPASLWPLRGAALQSEDLRISASTEELRMIQRLLDHEGIAGHALLTQRDGSPWLEIVVLESQHAADYAGESRVPPSARPPGAPVYKYALWRYTGAVYRLDVVGAVEDEPILRPDWRSGNGG